MLVRIVIALLSLTGTVLSQSTVDILRLEPSVRSNGMGLVGAMQLDDLSGAANPAALGFLTNCYGAVSVYPSTTSGMTGFGVVVNADRFLADRCPRWQGGVGFQYLERGRGGDGVIYTSGRPDTQQNQDGSILGGTEFYSFPPIYWGAPLDMVSLGVGYDGLFEFGVGVSWKRYALSAAGSKSSVFDIGVAIRTPIVWPNCKDGTRAGWQTNLDFVSGLSLSNLGSNSRPDDCMVPKLRKVGVGAEIRVARRQLEWAQITAGLEWKTLLLEDESRDFYADLQSREPLTEPAGGNQTTRHYGVELTIIESVSLRWGVIRAAYQQPTYYPGLAGSTTDPERPTRYYSRTTYGLGLSTAGLRELMGWQPDSGADADRSFGAFLLANLNLEFAYAQGFLPNQDRWLNTDFYSLSITLGH